MKPTQHANNIEVNLDSIDLSMTYSKYVQCVLITLFYCTADTTSCLQNVLLHLIGMFTEKKGYSTYIPTCDLLSLVSVVIQKNAINLFFIYERLFFTQVD